MTSISPTSGSTAGGTSVTITGTNLTGASAVTIGGTAATNVTVVSSTSITATTPAKTAGTASVLVTTSGGTNAANTLFTYATPTPTGTYCVSGAGNDAYNGTYNYVSGDQYVKVGSSGTTINYNGDGTWFFYTSNGEGYYTGGDYGSLPLTGWQNSYGGNGTGTVPTITEGQCVVTLVDPYCVAGADNAAVNGTYSYKSGSSPTNMYFSSGYWEKVGGTIQIGYNNMQSRYTISEGYSDFYSAESGATVTASLTGLWSVAYGGAGTAPTVTVGACS